MARPLQWCVDWNHLTFRQRFLIDGPFWSTRDRAYRDILRQLRKRSEADLAAWDAYPADVAKLAKELAGMIQAEGIWPFACFLPDDPADIVLAVHMDFTDKWDVLPAYYSIIKKESGAEMDVAFWERLQQGSMTYAEAVAEICMAKVNSPQSPTKRRSLWSRLLGGLREKARSLFGRSPS